MTNPTDDYADFAWPYGPMCFLPAAFETDAVPPETLRYLKEHGLPCYTPLYKRFNAFENGLQKQEEVSREEGRNFFVIGWDSPNRTPASFGRVPGKVHLIEPSPNDVVMCVDSEGKVYSYIPRRYAHSTYEYPSLAASSLERFSARLVLYTQEFACLEPDKVAAIRNAPKNAEGRSSKVVYSDQVEEKLREIDPAAPIDDDEGEGLFWSEALLELFDRVGEWHSIPFEQW